MEPIAPTEAELESRRAANAQASADALRMAAEQRARDAAEGRPVGDAAIVQDILPSLKDKLLGEQFGDPATLRPREGAGDEE